jgi:hypothetical protein
MSRSNHISQLCMCTIDANKVSCNRPVWLRYADHDICTEIASHLSIKDACSDSDCFAVFPPVLHLDNS